MPLYRFECDVCQVESLVKLSISNRNNVLKCTSCDDGELRRLIDAPPSNVLEVGNKYRDKAVRKDIKEVLRKRTKQDSIDKIGDIVEKHGLDTVKKTNLLTKDGRKKNSLKD